MTTATEANGHVANGNAEPFLSEAHRRELAEDSGLTEATIRAAGIYTEQSCTALSAILNTYYRPKHGSAMVIPFLDESGTVLLRKVKPSNPPNDAKGKPKKYLHPKDTGARAYIPPDAWKAINDLTARLVITEGEKKALAATQAGFHCISIPGVNCGQRKKSVALSPDLARIEWKGRTVYLCFDSDAETNDQVELALRKLAAALLDRGATVLVVRIPSGPNGEKVGLDDYLVAHGAGEFQKLLDKAQEPEPADAGDLKGAAKDADPATEAKHILAKCELSGRSRLIFWRGSFWYWNKGCYREMPTEELRAELVKHLNEHWLFVSTHIVSNVLEQLKSMAILRAIIEPGTWLSTAPMGWKADECVATATEVIHLPSLVEGSEVFSWPASPSYFTPTAVEFSVDIAAPPPNRFLGFLGDVWPEDQQCIDTLQEIFGYLLTADTSQHKMFMLVGPPRSGKGTIGRLLRALIGKGNVVAPTLSGLLGTFALQPMLGKSVAIIADARMSNRPDTPVVVERLLSISGEDTQTVERKHQTSVTCKLPTRFLILSNELPRLNDASGAIVSRIILLTMSRSFLGKEDSKLFEKLLPELPSIFLWAVGGWARLRQRGYFLQPDSSLEALSDLSDLASPVGAFVKECCIVGPAEVVQVADLFTAWRKWCESQGRDKYAGTVQSFGRDLLAVEPNIRRAQPREHGNRIRVYQGIGLRGFEY